MPELTVDDVEQYTGGRLSAGDDETERLLAAALAAARRYCGWHVTPVVEDDEHTLDGPGELLLALPTQQLIELTELIEDGIAIDVVTDVRSSRRGTITKKSAYRWWTSNYGGINVTMTHGFTEAEAADWRAVVLSVVDRLSTGSMVAGTMVAGPFQFTPETLTVESAFTTTERAVLDSYRLTWAWA